MLLYFLSLENSDARIYHYWPDSRYQQTALLNLSEWKLLYSHLKFFKSIVCHLRWRKKTPSKACQYLVLGLHHNLSCLLPSATSFLLRFIFFETSGAHMKAVRWPSCPVRFRRSEEKCVPANSQSLDVEKLCCDQKMPQLVLRCSCAMYWTPLMSGDEFFFNGFLRLIKHIWSLKINVSIKTNELLFV